MEQTNINLMASESDIKEFARLNNQFYKDIPYNCMTHLSFIMKANMSRIIRKYGINGIRDFYDKAKHETVNHPESALTRLINGGIPIHINVFEAIYGKLKTTK